MDVETVTPVPTSTPPPPSAPALKDSAPDARLSSFQAAYEDAKKQHSQATPAEPAPAPAARTDPEPDATLSQSKAPEPDATDSAQEPTFLSDEEASALQTEFADDPAGYRKALDKRFNKALTQSTQRLSSLRKALEPYADTLDGLDTDPQSTIRALAQKYGVSLGETATQVTKPAAPPADALTRAKAMLGEELSFLAPTIAPLIAEIDGLKAQLGPVQTRLEDHDHRTAEAEVSREMKAFEAKYPDWQKHEAAMMALAQKFPPSGTTSEAEWMEFLYRNATYDTAIAAGTQQAIQRMTKAAKTSETSRPAVDGSRVHAVMPTNATFRDAAEAAKRGEVWERRR